jgi:hypothetical protein
VAIAIADMAMQTARFLCFGPLRPNLRDDRRRWLAFGFLCTWLAGVGRYWDHPDPAWWQVLGLGSVIYVVLLSLFLWLLLMPLKPRVQGYTPILMFVLLTSPPAWLYAIPVERFMSIESAAKVNAWFLAIVATWRVVLWVLFLRRAAGFSRAETATMVALPLAAILTALATLNLEQAVFNLMGGIREHAGTSADAAYAIVFVLMIWSWIALPLSLLAYAVHAYKMRFGDRTPRPSRNRDV